MEIWNMFHAKSAKTAVLGIEQHKKFISVLFGAGLEMLQPSLFLTRNCATSGISLKFSGFNTNFLNFASGAKSRIFQVIWLP